MFFNQGQFNIKQSWGDEEEPKPSGLNKEAKPPLLPEKSKKKNSTEILDILDNEIAKKILKDFQDEGGFKKRDNPILQPKGNGPTPKSNIPTPKAANPKDSDLLVSMANRLSKLEATNSNQREEIKEKSKLIEKLQSELSILKQDNNADTLLKLKEENAAYKKQINEMDKFLNDYGLKWVGAEAKEQNKDNFDATALKRDIDNSKPIYKSRLPKEVDINLIARRIEELNFVIANEGESEIVRQKNGAHVFKKKEPIHIAFYKDGLIIKGYPFYKYLSREAKQIIEDVLDGYFPSILKHKYPEGTLFKLLVKIDEDFGTSIANNNLNGNRNDLGSIEDRIFQPLSKDAFLNELPREVIKNGKIIPIRDAIAKKIGHISTDATPEALQEGIVNIKTYVSEKESNGGLIPEQIKKIVTLKIRTESGKRTLVLKVLSTDSISLVYKLVKDYSETKKFEVWGGYPPQAYINDEKMSLEDLEIFEDSTFNLRAL